MSFPFANKALPIPRISGLDSSTFSKQYRNKNPVILPDIISSWIPVNRWTPEYLTNALQQTYEDQLQVFVSKDNKHFINHPDVAHLVTMTSSEFASHVFNSPHSNDTTGIDQMKYYLRSFSMPDVLFRDIDTLEQADLLLNVILSEYSDKQFDDSHIVQETRQVDEHEMLLDKGQCDDLNVSQDFEKNTEPISAWEDFLSPVTFSADDDNTADNTRGLEDKQSTSSAKVVEDKDIHSQQPRPYDAHSAIFNAQTMQLWIGTRGNVTPLHYDRNHGLLAQIAGRKELVLFSHEDTHSVYPHPSCSDRAHTSRINLRRLCEKNYAEIFPKLNESQPYTCILQPGELLYTPPFWWHDVTSLDDCVSVTLPWDIDGYEEFPPSMLRY